MAQPTFAQIRAALAAQVTAVTGARCTADRPGQINPPCGFVAPATGSFIRYAQTMDAETDYTLRVIMFVAMGDSHFGEDILDPFADPQSATSVYAAVQASPTLGGVVAFAAVTEATGYGVMNVNGVDYLACHFIVEIGT